MSSKCALTHLLNARRAEARRKSLGSPRPLGAQDSPGNDSGDGTEHFVPGDYPDDDPGDDFSDDSGDGLSEAASEVDVVQFAEALDSDAPTTASTRGRSRSHAAAESLCP